MSNIERRAIAEIRAAAEDRSINGTAIVFNKESQLLGDWFTEIVKPGAADEALINSSDILMLFNHDDRRIPLARSKRGKGSLSINITPTGVDFKFNARNTPQGDEILYAVKAGDIDACSFAFRVAEDEWQQKPDGTYLRIIHKFESLHDFSLVNEPAYLDTSARSIKADFEKRNAPADPPTPPTLPTPPADPPTPPSPAEPPQESLEDFYAPFDKSYYETFEASIAEIKSK